MVYKSYYSNDYETIIYEQIVNKMLTYGNLNGPFFITKYKKQYKIPRARYVKSDINCNSFKPKIFYIYERIGKLY